MKDDQTKSENKFSILGSIKGILRIATGLTLGTVTLAAGLTRGIVGSVGHAALTVAGAVATVAAFANHTLNFLGHRALKSFHETIGDKDYKIPSSLPFKDTFLGKAYNFTAEHGNKAFSNIPDVLSGKKDKHSTTNKTLLYAAQLTLAMSPKQRLEASKKRAARGSEETEPLLLKKKAEVQQAPIPIKAEPTKENLTLLKQTIAKRKAEAQAHAEVSTVIKKVRKTRARTSTLNRIPFSSRTRSRFD